MKRQICVAKIGKVTQSAAKKATLTWVKKPSIRPVKIMRLELIFAPAIAFLSGMVRNS